MSKSTPPPSSRPGGLRYPLRTRLVVAAVLVLAVGGFVLAGLRTDTDPEPEFAVTGTTDDQRRGGGNGVEARIPPAGAQIVGQASIGIDLEPGWTGELLFLPSEGNAVQLPEDELDIVSELNRIIYQPRPDKTVERLPGGESCVLATIWDQVRGREASEREVSWCFFVV